VAVRWASSADKHGITHEETLYAIGHAVHLATEFDEPRVPGTASPALYIGPAGPCGQLIEVLVVLTPPRDLFVFHSMPLRQLTAERADYHPEED
jgi:hypothetical protein